jgi:CRP-like cAMP-binding protein
MKIDDRKLGLQLLRGVEFFHAFTDDELEEILEISTLRRYKLHDLIIRESGSGNSFYVILEGGAKVVKGHIPHDMKELDIISEGECFGEMSLLLGAPRTANVIAGVNCTLFEIDADSLDQLGLRVQVKMYKEFATEMARRLTFSNMG